MPKHHKQGVGTELMGAPDELIKLIIKEPSDQKWVIKEISNEGPPHKQALTALLLKRLYKLVKTMEKSSGSVFVLQKGSTVNTFTHEEAEVVMPVDIPVNLRGKVNKEEVIDTVSHAPLHELLAYTMCLQVIEWGIKTAGAEN